MLKIILCDDIPEHAELLEAMLREIIDFPCEIRSFYDSDSLIRYIAVNDADILFTDIKMPCRDGIETAREIYEKNKNLQIIFLSAYTRYAQDVFCVRPVYYLTKPLEKDKVREALKLAVDNIKKQKFRIKIKNRDICLIPGEINFIESIQRTAVFHMDNSIEEFHIKLDEIEKLLPDNFLRCHQSFIINMDKIKQLRQYETELYSGDIVPVPKKRYGEIKDAIRKYWDKSV